MLMETGCLRRRSGSRATLQGRGTSVKRRMGLRRGGPMILLVSSNIDEPQKIAQYLLFLAFYITRYRKRSNRRPPNPFDVPDKSGLIVRMCRVLSVAGKGKIAGFGETAKARSLLGYRPCRFTAGSRDPPMMPPDGWIPPLGPTLSGDHDV